MDLTDYPVVISWPVQWGDQDLFGHVNNTVYFRWYESSRIAYLDRIGVSDMMERERVGPILAAICCNYRRQLNFPDTVEIGSRITRIGRSSADDDPRHLEPTAAAPGGRRRIDDRRVRLPDSAPRPRARLDSPGD